MVWVFDGIAVELEEHQRRRKIRPFVAIDERVIENQGEVKGCGHLEDVRVQKLATE